MKKAQCNRRLANLHLHQVGSVELSTNAHNVKIITRAGKVILKGPVQTDAEKRSVETKVAEVAGAGSVTSEVSVTKSTSKASTSQKPDKGAAAPKEK